MIVDYIGFWELLNGIKTALFCLGSAVLVYDLKGCLEEMIFGDVDETCGVDK